MKYFLTLVLFVVLTFCLGAIAKADDTAALPLPIIDDSSTVTAGDTATVTTYTVTPTATLVTAQQAVDDAETGTEVVTLVSISVLGGIGIFLIKRYFDLKKLSL